MNDCAIRKEDIHFFFSFFSRFLSTFFSMFFSYSSATSKKSKIFSFFSNFKFFFFLRLFNIIGKWIEHYWSDFEKEPACKTIVTDFLSKIDDIPSKGVKLKLEKKVRGKEKKKKKDERWTDKKM